MATTTVTDFITRNVTHTVTATAASAISTNRAAPQGGILEGGNPTVYDPKNPIIIFIIQVCAETIVFESLDAHKSNIGWHSRSILSNPSLATLKDQTTSCHS